MIPATGHVSRTFVGLLSADNAVVQFHPAFDQTEMHTHDFLEIAYVAGGHGWHVLGEQISRCQGGDLYLIDRGDAHMFLCENDAPLDIYNLIFVPALLDDSLQNRQNFASVLESPLLRAFRLEDVGHSLSVRFAKKQQSIVMHIFSRMLEEYSGQSRGREEMLRLYAAELLTGIFRQTRIQESGRPIPQWKVAAFNGVFDYIQQHFAEPIALETLASLATFSPSYFSRLFKACTGIGVTEYIQQVRVHRACQLLRETSRSVPEISEEIGYGDANYFGKVFKRQIGVTPAAYRKNHR